MVAPDMIERLSEFRKVKILMPECDSLAQGRDLMIKIQSNCSFPLVYVQLLGHDPALLLWRMRDECHAMEGYTVERHQA